MGKYMRSKCGGGAAGDSKPAPAAVLGARTRSRAAATAVAGPAKRRKHAAETTTTTRAVDEAVSGRNDGGGAVDEAVSDRDDAAAACYLHLRSRRLLFKAAAPRGDLAAEEEASRARLDSNSGGPEEAVVVGISRCSGTASSTVDVAARERSGGEAEACEGRDVESSVSDSECDGRERRETTPCSRPPVDSSDLESSQATTDEQERKRCCRRDPATTTTTSSTAAFHLQPRSARMPAAAEIEHFFFAAEKAQAERFAAKYNFDVALGVPLDAGRFEWTPVATI
ncbi:unnamed protein product [Alopecurus aequalis]